MFRRVLLMGVLLLSFNVFASSSNYQKVQEMYQEIQSKFQVPETSIADLKESLGSENLVVVDVREEAERKVSGIKGALSKAEFEAQLSRLKHKQVVVYCTIGYRSAEYVGQLTSQGLQASNLVESLLGWVHNRGKIYDGEGQRTRKVHVYGPKWNLLPRGYKAIW